MHSHRKSRYPLFVFLLCGCALLCGNFAVAEPPPPDFDNWVIVNELNDPVTNITVTLMKAKKSANYSVDAGLEPAMTFTIPTLEGRPLGQSSGGGEMKLSLKNVWCIAKIQVTAQCPSGSVSFDCTAHSGNFVIENPPPQKDEYAGFSDNNGASVLRLKFFKKSGAANARLEATSRWEGNAQAQSITKAFQ